MWFTQCSSSLVHPASTPSRSARDSEQAESTRFEMPLEHASPGMSSLQSSLAGLACLPTGRPGRKLTRPSSVPLLLVVRPGAPFVASSPLQELLLTCWRWCSCLLRRRQSNESCRPHRGTTGIRTNVREATCKVRRCNPQICASPCKANIK